MEMQRLTCGGFLTGVLISLAVIGLLVGCASRPETVRLHDQEDLGDQEVAFLAGDREYLMLHAVDGRESPSGKKGFGSSWDGTYQLEVLPGEHVLTVSLYLRTTSNEISNRFSSYEKHYELSSLENVEISLRVEAGHTYILTSEWDFDSEEWFPVVIDQTTDRTVFKDGPYLFKRVEVGDFFESPGRSLRR
jgi:hypothetical protein